MVKIRSNICIFEKKVVSLRDFINYMRNRLKIQYFFGCIMLLLFSACNVTKFVPQGEYLLNDVKVKVEGTKDVSSSDLMKYIQQKQNTEILGFGSCSWVFIIRLRWILQSVRVRWLDV